MGIQVRSEAYLQSKDFYKKYEFLVWELYRVRNTLESLSKEYDPDQVIVQIQKRIDFLRESWTLEDEALNKDHKPPYRELFLWTQMIVNRAADLLSSNLKSALK